MSDSVTDRLMFTLETNTQSYVSEQTGIPRSTLSYVARGLRELPADYYVDVNNFYSRYVADRLFDDGAPVHQATRFANASIATVKSKEIFIRQVAQGITEQHLIRQAANDGLSGAQIETLFTDAWYETYDAIVSSMQQSEKPLEEWAEQYPIAK
jgi:hypothetical protein